MLRFSVRYTDLPARCANGSQEPLIEPTLTDSRHDLGFGAIEKSAFAPRRGSFAREDHVAQERIDLARPPIAAENPIVPDARLHVMALEVAT